MGYAVEKFTKESDELGIDEFRGFAENSPVNIMFADLNFNIKYVNPKSLETLKTIESHLPVKADKILGSNIDIFHKNPAHQRGLLANPRNLPIRTNINVGPEILDLEASAVYNESGDVIGTQVTWSIVTERIKRDNEIARMANMLEECPVNILFADLDFNLKYMNRSSRETLKQIEHLMPMPVEKCLNQSIDIFHKNPAHPRKILSDPRNLPHTAKIKLGNETLKFLASAIHDKDGTYVGAMVTWELITDQMKLMASIEEASTQLASAAAELDATATSLSSASEETNAQANQAAASAEQIATGIRTVANNTEEMTQSIKEISRNANEASVMSNETASQAKITNETITRLGSSSLEIGNVIKVINSIAQQTNLLALNATIEAARAGDAGRGFAVVANEVKELAKQTASATEDITNKIESIQKESSNAVDAIGVIGDSIDKVNNIAGSIAASVEEQMATTTEVSRAVKEANEGVGTIAENIRTVSVASSHTSKNATELLDASKGLTELATKLQELLKNMAL